MSELLRNWTEASDDNAKALAAETLILDASESILEVMEKEEISKAELATTLGKTKSYVTQLLNGSRNMTLRTFAEIAFALNMTAAVALKHKLALGTWHEAGELTCVKTVSRPLLAANEPAEVIGNQWHTVSLVQRKAA